MSLAGRKLAPAHVAQALDLIADFEHCRRLDDLFDILTIAAPPS
jgi:hypothetical protein